MVNQFLSGFLQSRADVGRNATAIDHRLEVSNVRDNVVVSRVGSFASDALRTADLSIDTFN